MLYFFGRGVATKLSVCEFVDSGKTRAPFVHVDIMGGHAESEVG